ncbi:BTB/POZ and MATH domain-containing protein 6-like [Contarinia nasturtii]|uniref:BTB/POZ and MATH domain-containing protein 6-like n=1 Tax=Contarinia nasturtii TaxID=265458 RepID=UPI0012D3EBA6|nr:BTB/POZ and MATH domain-containing protein 6-like [Contarinia nasturtii]
MADLITSEDSNSPEDQAELKEARNTTAKLFDTKLFSDVTFIVKGVEFRAHKNILSTRYVYFEILFSERHETEKEVTMHGIKPEVFKIVLEFIYKGQLSDWKEKMEKHADDLIKAADMYGIHGLRNKCEKYIIRAGKINVHTACEYFILADTRNAPKLKATALKFISENLEGVKKTSGYIEFKRHRTSITDVVEMLSPSKRLKLLN